MHLVASSVAVLCALGSIAHAATSLRALLDAARSQSIAVSQARGELDVARAGMTGARRSVFQNPYLEVQLQHGPSVKDVNVDAFVQLPFELAGQRGARIAENDALQTWRKAALAEAELAVDAQVVARFGELIVSEQRVAIAARAEADARTQAHDIAERLRVGDATVVDSSEAEAEVVRWQMMRAEGELARVAAATSLSELTGLVVDVEGMDAAPLPTPIGSDPIDAALKGSPSLRVLGAERGFDAASGTRFRRERMLPFSFIVNTGRADDGAWRAGGGISYTFPITQRNQGEIAQADAEMRRVDAVLARIRNVITSRARGAQASLVLSTNAVRAQDLDGVPSAQKLVNAAYESYSAGKGELLRVLIARRDLAVARERRLDFVERAWRAYAELVALGAVRP